VASCASCEARQVPSGQARQPQAMSGKASGAEGEARRPLSHMPLVAAFPALVAAGLPALVAVAHNASSRSLSSKCLGRAKRRLDTRRITLDTRRVRDA
jgi:hypothetical protein